MFPVKRASGKVFSTGSQGTKNTVMLLRIALIVCLVQVGNTAALAQGRSPAELIAMLTDASGRPGRLHSDVIMECSSAAAESRFDKAVTDELVRMGDSALPPLETALDSLEARGGYSKFARNASWLVRAYGEIKGKGSLQRLRRMSLAPRLSFLGDGLAKAIASALEITSYVPESGDIPERDGCGDLFEPESVLDRLIRAWLQGDQESAERSLTRQAEASLRSLANGNTRLEQSQNAPRLKPPSQLAVGYRFVSEGWWSMPSEARPKVCERSPACPSIETDFVGRMGQKCGSLRVSFVINEKALEYRVDNADIRNLYDVILMCAGSN